MFIFWFAIKCNWLEIDCSIILSNCDYSLKEYALVESFETESVMLSSQHRDTIYQEHFC